MGAGGGREALAVSGWHREKFGHAEHWRVEQFNLVTELWFNEGPEVSRVSLDFCNLSPSCCEYNADGR